jgi:methionyl-tRNA formyltransferase
MRILFAGTPRIAIPSLERIAKNHEVCAVLTIKDRLVGRGKKTEQSPVKTKAEELGLPIIEAERMDDRVHAAVRSLTPDLIVVVALGRIFRKNFLDLFPRGGINLHPSLLPKYRGPSPVTAAIVGGDTETGVTIQRLALKVDTGDILAQTRVALTGEETTGSLSERLALLGAELLEGVISRLEKGGIEGTPQNEGEASYCRLVRKDDGKIDWTLTACEIERRVRAYDPWPRAATAWEGRSLLVLKSRVYTGTLGSCGLHAKADAAPGTVLARDPEWGILVQTGGGILAVERLQLEFKKALDWRSFLNGCPGVMGARLGG